MKILAVSPYLPVPQDQGDPIRALTVLQALESLGDLTVVAVERPESARSDVESLRGALRASQVLTFRPLGDRLRRPKWFLRALRAAWGVTTFRPPWVLRHWSRAAAGELRRRSASADVVVLLSEGAGIFAKRSKAPVIWDKSNVLGASALASFISLSSPYERVKSLLLWPHALAYEWRTLRRCSHVWVTTHRDGAMLKRVYGRSADAVIPSIVDVDESASAVIDPQSNVLLWMSSLAYAPNVDGLDAFLRVAGPTLEEHGLVLRVVGSGASPALADRLSSTPGVDYRGFVTDLAEACSGVAAAVIPLWAGAGVKLKTVTLVALGIPIIATEQALEGLPDELAFERVHDNASFVPAIVHLLERRDTLQGHASTAREILRTLRSRESLLVAIQRALVAAGHKF